MTLSTTTSRAVYAGNGVTTIFSFPYRFLVNGDLEVTLFDADGVPDPQVLTTDYTVLGADLDAGGSVTMIVAPAVGQTLVIRRVVDLTQETDYNSGDAFPAETHERALDKLTMMDQQLQEQIDRSITVPLDNTTFSGQLPEIVPGNFVRINDAGTALEFVDALDPGDLVVSPYIETLLDDANAAAARTTLGAQAAGNYANSGAVGSSGLTMATARVLGRVTASTGAIEELTAAQVTSTFVTAASETAQGKVELATTAEASTGTDTTRAVTAAGVEAHMTANALGWGQTAQSVTGSRALETDYTNSTGRPIFVSARVLQNSGAASSYAALIVDGVQLAWCTSLAAGVLIPSGVCGVVPPGSVYSIRVQSGAMLLSAWSEVR